MKKILVVLMVLPAMLFAAAVFAENDLLFNPTATNIVATHNPRTPTPFTRVWTQSAGELPIARLQEKYTNLTLNWAMMLAAMSQSDHPTVAYMNVAWGNQSAYVLCTMNVPESNLFQLTFRIDLEVVGGTIPAGTVVGVSEFRVRFENLKTVLTADLQFEPDFFPEVIPEGGLTITDQVVPGSWKTAKRGLIKAEHWFTSVEPPSGEDPIVTHLVDNILVF